MTFICLIFKCILPLTGSGNQSVQVGDVIVGRTSNARGFVADAGSGNYFSLEQVSGRFVNGEVMERDGRVIGTLEAAWTFDFY